MKFSLTLLLLISFYSSLLAQQDSIDISLLNGKWDFIETLMNETKSPPMISMDLSTDEVYDQFRIDSTGYGTWQSFDGYGYMEYAGLKYELKNNKAILIFTYKSGEKSIGEIIILDEKNLKIKFEKHEVIYKRD